MNIPHAIGVFYTRYVFQMNFLLYMYYIVIYVFSLGLSLPNKLYNKYTSRQNLLKEDVWYKYIFSKYFDLQRKSIDWLLYDGNFGV